MNTRQQKFVTEYLKWGIPALAYANAYNKPNPNGRAIESAANRLMRNPEVKQAIHDAEDRIRHQVEQEIADRQALDVFTIEQKRHLLKQIATGDMLVEQRYKTGDCRHCTQFVRPDINQMLRAIDLDNRMAAHYPPPPQKMKIPPLNLAERSHEPMRVTPEGHPHGEIPPSKEVPFEQRAEDVHSRGTESANPVQQQPNAVSSLPPLKKTSIRQQKTTTDNTCPPLPVPTVSGAGVSRSDGGGALAPDTPEEQHFATTDNKSPLPGVPIAIGIGVHSRGTENTLPEMRLPLRGIGGQLAQDPREEQQNTTTTDNKTDDRPTITHDELMELLYPQEEKLQPMTTSYNNSA